MNGTCSNTEPEKECQVNKALGVYPHIRLTGLLTALLLLVCMQTASAEPEIGKNDSSIQDEDLSKGKKSSVSSKNNYSSRESRYIGNLESHKFHRASCDFAQIMAESRRIDFSSSKQAIDAGMKPCNWCMPQWSITVQGRVINQQAGCNETKVSH